MKTEKKVCRNWNVIKIWVIHGKNEKNIWKSGKKLETSFEEIGNNFLNKFSTHFGRNFG